MQQVHSACRWQAAFADSRRYYLEHENHQDDRKRGISGPRTHRCRPLHRRWLRAKQSTARPRYGDSGWSAVDSGRDQLPTSRSHHRPQFGILHFQWQLRNRGCSWTPAGKVSRHHQRIEADRPHVRRSDDRRTDSRGGPRRLRRKTAPRGDDCGRQGQRPRLPPDERTSDANRKDRKGDVRDSGGGIS